MSEIRTNDVWAPVPNAFVEFAPSTLIGQFIYQFPELGPLQMIYIRPGQQQQQEYLNMHGADWLLYTRSVMSYHIEWFELMGDSVGGASLIVEFGAVEDAGALQTYDSLVFHIVAGDGMVSHKSGIELPCLQAKIRIVSANDTGAPPGPTVRGTIIMRAV